MPRKPRLENQAGWHHVTNRGLDRQVVFRSIDDRLDLGRLISAACEEFGVTVFAYCLMDNHFHLVVSCPGGGLSPFMQDVSAKFTRHSNERHGGDGPIFRGRFSSRPIQSHEYLLNAVRYVHRNPLAIRPPVGLAAYRWSSHRTYLGLRSAPSWLDCSTVLDWFQSPQSFAGFVDADADLSSVPELHVDDLLMAFQHAAEELAPTMERAPQGVLRTASYLALDRLTPSTRGALIDRIAPASPDALDQAVRRARRVDADGTYSEVVQHALDLLVPAFRLCLTQPERQSQAGRVAS